MILSDKAAFAVEFLDLPEASKIDGAQWEDFQLQFLNNTSRYGIEAKSRQVGWSWTSALDALTDSVFNPGVPYVFVSINQYEAQEKIRYARAIIEAFDQPIREQFFQLKRDSQTELEFTNETRLISHACRPVRGKARARLYYDEMAHYPANMDRQIYTAGVPVTTKGGYIRIGSSPMGASGVFWEIVTEQMRKYPGFDGNRRIIPWWHIRALCTDTKTSKEAAPHMSTEDRVYAFGTQALIDIFENMFLEDFQQEYECSWVDEVVAWISWETIKANQRADLQHWKSDGSGIDAIIDEMQRAIRKGEIELALTGGVDVGRKRDLTELCVCGKTTSGAFPVRLLVSLDRVKFDVQQDIMARIFSALPFTSVLIDQNGIGMQLAEGLSERFFSLAGLTSPTPAKRLGQYKRGCKRNGATHRYPLTGIWRIRYTRSRKHPRRRTKTDLTPRETKGTTPTNSGRGRWQLTPGQMATGYGR